MPCATIVAGNQNLIIRIIAQWAASLVTIYDRAVSWRSSRRFSPQHLIYYNLEEGLNVRDSVIKNLHTWKLK